MHDEAWMDQVLRDLKALGVTIAIDDFGTGYSSFSRLREFPIDRLKIDRSFVQHVHSDGQDEAIAAAIIRMAKTLNLEVVAEGVEELPQLLMLQEHGCTIAQGYLLSKPLTASETFSLLRRLAEHADGSRTQRFRRIIG
jgi:EAL domain-containing protein (putative c-di-GMP-specific phosphodiesterase class I)